MRGFYVKSWQTVILCHPSSWYWNVILILKQVQHDQGFRICPRTRARQGSLWDAELNSAWRNENQTNNKPPSWYYSSSWTCFRICLRTRDKKDSRWDAEINSAWHNENQTNNKPPSQCHPSSWYWNVILNLFQDLSADKNKTRLAVRCWTKFGMTKVSSIGMTHCA